MKSILKRTMAFVLSASLALMSFSDYVKVTAYAATYRNGAQSGPSSSYKAGKYYTHYTQVPITGDNRTDLIAIALSQLGYQEGNSNGNFSGEVSGSNNYVEFSYNMGDLGIGYGGSDYPWCASFVSWCLYQSRATDHATYSSLARFHSGDYSYIWKEISCSQWVTQLKGAGYFKYSGYEGGSYTPQSGDLVFFQNSGGVAHIGICLYTSGGRIYTVEGNTSDAQGLEANGGGVYFKNYDLSSSYLYGYGVLPYKTNSSVAKIDYSGSNPTPGLYISNAVKYIFATEDATSYSSLLPRFAMFEVTEVCSNGRLKIKYGDVVGYVMNNTDRVIQLSSTEEPDYTVEERATLKTLITKAETAKHYDYSEETILNIRSAYATAKILVADKSTTKETEAKMKNIITALQTALDTTGSNTIGNNNKGVFISGVNKVVSSGDCIMYTSDFNGNGLVTIDNANIRYTVNVVFEWDADKCVNVVKSVSEGTGSSTPSIQLTSGQFLLAAHEWEYGAAANSNPVKYSGTNYNILNGLQVGDVIKLSGASIYDLPAVIESKGVEPCAYAKFIKSNAIIMNGRNEFVNPGDFTLFTPEYSEGNLTPENSNVHNTLNIIGEWDNENEVWRVKQKNVGNGVADASSDINIKDGQIVIAGLAVKDVIDTEDGSNENFEKLNSVHKGDKIIFSGISPTSSTYVSVGANVEFISEPREELTAELKSGESTENLTKALGSSITLDVSASGGSGDYTYKFAVLNVDTGKWSILRDFDSNSSYSYNLNYAGTKQFAVTVKDSEENTVAANRITVKVVEAEKPLKGTLKVNNSTDKLTANVGSSITLKASGEGGSGSYTYKFAVLNVDTGKWSILKDFSNVSSYTYNLNYPGAKQFAVTVKDSKGRTVATNRIEVKVEKPLEGRLNVNGETEYIVKKLGSSITLKASGEGGSGSYTYKFAVLNVDTGKWSVLKDFSNASSYKYDLNYPGTKQFAVTVKDCDGKTVGTNRITVKVNEELSAKLSSNGKSDDITLKVGDTIKLDVSASGGTEDYTYKYVVYNENTSVWYTLKDYCKESSYTSNLSSAGTKQFVVSVKDSSGEVVSTKRLTVNVK